MIRVLHAIDTPGPGGAETIFVNLVNKLNKNGFKSYAAIPGPGWIYDELLTTDVDVFCIDPKGSLNFRYLVYLIKLIKKHKIDIVQSHLLGSNVYCSIAGLLCCVPVVSTFHGFSDVEVNNRVMRMKTGLINIGSKKIVFVSRSLREEFIKQYGFNQRKSITIYNGIDARGFSSDKDSFVRKALGFSDDHVLIGSVGNLRRAKGYENLLRAARIVVNKCPECKFVVAGERSGKLYEKLLILRHQSKLENEFFFLGFIKDVDLFFKSLDIFVLPSISEGFSISTIEAMASKIPVIVGRSGGPEEIVNNNVNGLIVDVACDYKLARGILKIKSMESHTLNNMVCEAQNTSKQFTVNRMLDKYKIVYESLSKKRKYKF